MDIAQLRTLVHVAELGSLTAAAERLAIAQPALSRQIRLLETELSGALFMRHGRGMRLTELGHRVVALSGEILLRIDDIRRCAADPAPQLAGKVRIGMTPTVAEVATLPLARAVRDQHPAMSLCFTSGFSGHLMEWLKRGELDCCVTYEQDASRLVHTVPVLDERLLLVSAPDLAVADKTPLPFGQLAQVPMVLPSPAHGLRTILDTVATRAGIVLQPSLEADSLTAMIDLVRAGFGATILPYAAIHARVILGELVATPLIDPVPQRRVLIAYPADRPVLPAARFVGETFQRVAAELVGTGNWAGQIIPG